MPDLAALLSSLRSVVFDFRLTIDRVRVSWREADWHKLDRYQLKAYLLLDEGEEDIEGEGEGHQDHQEGVPGGGVQQPPRSPLSLDASITTTTTEKSSSPLLSPKDLPASKQALKCTCPGAKQKTEVPTKKKTTPPKKKKPGSSSSSTQTQQHFPFKKLLATITATRSLTLTTGDTEICFDDAAIAFRTAIPVEANDNGNGGGSSKEGGGGGRPRKQFVFRSRVVRLKLERIRHGAVGSHHLMGFVDVDLAQLRQNCLKVSGCSSPSSPSPSSSSPSNSLNSYSSSSSSSSSAYIHLPFIFFTDYSRHIGRHHHHLISRFTGAPRFSFDLRLKLDSTPLESNFNRQSKVLGASSSNSTLLTVPSSPNLDDLDLWISAESLLMTTTAGGHLRDDQGGNGSIESSSSSSSSSGVSSLMVSRSISGSGSSSTSSSQSLYLSQLLLRRDSLPNQSDDRELKYHDTPSISRTAHLLNLLGMLPPGQLFRVSIHFGQLEQLDELLQLTTEQQQQQMACIPKKPTSAAASVYASFEVKHQKHQPTIFYAHHQRSSICCRTRPLTSDDFLVNGGGHRGEEGGGGEGEGVRNGSSSHGDSPGNSFDQHFTFFERFHVRDSPPTVLAIRHGSTGKKLFTYRCHLADYITARSVNQFFCLSSEKALFKASGGGGNSSMAANSANTVCRLQFSIAVKPVVIAGTSSSSSSSMTSKVEGVGAAAAASAAAFVA